MNTPGAPSDGPCGRVPGRSYPVTVSNDWHRLYSEYPEVYDEFAVYQDSKHKVKQTVSALASLSGKVFLDIGSGTGKFTFEFAPLVGSVCSLEPCFPLLDLARRRARTTRPTEKLTFVQAEAASIPLPNDSVDIAFSGHAITAIKSHAVVGGHGLSTQEEQPRYVARSKALGEMERVVRTGGWLFSLSASPDCYGGALMDLILGDRRAAWSQGKEQFLTWMRETQGFAEIQIDTDWSFPDSKSAAACFGFIFGDHVAQFISGRNIHEFQNLMVLQFRRKGESPSFPLGSRTTGRTEARTLPADDLFRAPCYPTLSRRLVR